MKILDAQDSQLKALLQASPLPIILIESDTTVRFWNLAAERVFGWTEEEVLGRPIPVVSEEQQEEARHFREITLQGKTFSGVSAFRRKKDGSLLSVKISAGPVPMEEGIQGIVLIFEDMTRQKPPVEWQALLSSADSSDHLVQFYSDKNFLAEKVAHFIAAGLRRDEAAVIIAVPERRLLFKEILGKEFDVDGLCGQGRLIFCDAREMSSKIFRHQHLDWKLFQETAGKTLERAKENSPTRRVRAYDEMANLLWSDGDAESAMEVEYSWNDLAKQHAFSLLCAYHADSFDFHANFPWGGVCAAHSHVISTDPCPRFENAVNQALNEVLGAEQANAVRTMNAEIPEAVPHSQGLISWLRQKVPILSDAVMNKARQHYHSSPESENGISGIA